MIVGRFNTSVDTSSGIDMDVTRASAGGFVSGTIDINRSNAALGARQYLTIITYSFAQFGSPAIEDVSENRIFTLTNMADDGGYQYRVRRVGGDDTTSDSIGLPATLGDWSAWSGGSVEPTVADSLTWSLFGPGEYSSAIQFQVRNPETTGDVVYDTTINIRIVYPA